MGHVDFVPCKTIQELSDLHDKYRRGVEDGFLIPLWLWDTKPFFAYAGSYQGEGVVLDEELLEEMFEADKASFQGRWN